MKILVQTNQEGRVEVVNRDTGKVIDNIKRIDVYINYRGVPTVNIEFKDVELKLESEHANPE